MFEFQAIGTKWFIEIDSEVKPREEIFKKIRDRIEEFESVYSRFRDNSIITEMSRKAGTYRLPDDAGELFALYKKFYIITGGLMTPLIGNTLSDAGYDAEYSFKQKSMKSPESWDEIFEYAYPHITMKKPALLDFGAGGKGYIVDIVGDLLKNEGVHSYIVDAGGDMLSKNKVLKVGLENPFDKTKVIGTVEISNQSIAGSAGNRRAWADFHHVINPKTLSSPKDISAVWVIAESTFLADMLTTALYFLSPQQLLEHFDFEFLIVRADMMEKSNGFKAELFVK